MRQLTLLLSFCFTISLTAQIHWHKSDVMQLEPLPYHRFIPMDSLEYIVEGERMRSAHGLALDALKADLDRKRDEFLGRGYHPMAASPVQEPEIDTGFTVQLASGIPNDNNIAISNEGQIVVCANSIMAVYDTGGTRTDFNGLSFWVSGLGSFPGTFDPHVRYDPIHDRFVMVFLDGGNSTTSDMLIAFSQTNDATGDWNFYKLPGNVHGDNTWSDYPFMALSTEELFVSVLLWQNGESGWDSEATNELIWQVDLDSAYAGGTINYQYWDSVRIGGRQVWNARPVQGGSTNYGPNMFLVANRPIDASSDSVFLIEITNTLESGTATMNVDILQSPVNYGIPPSAVQPDHTDKLRTNYADYHSAFLQNNKLHFVGNTNNTANLRPSIYYGVITDPGGANTLDARIFSSDSFDLNYPSICYAGADSADDHALINCLYVSDSIPAGTSVFAHDGEWNFSELYRVAEGVGSIRLNGDTLERWGDYTGIARRYNNPGECWLSGSTANNGSQITGNWVQKVVNPELYTSIGEPRIEIGRGFKPFPNPAKDWVRFKLELDAPDVIDVRWYSLDGRLLHQLQTETISEGNNTISLKRPSGVDGTVFLEISDSKGRVLRSGQVLLAQ